MSAKLGFKKKSRQDPPATSKAEVSSARPPMHTVSGMWIDPLGRIATRSVQLLVVVILAGAVVYTLLRLSVIALPILIALILSCALWPLVRLLRKFMSPLLAAWTVFLGSLLVIGGIGTALVYSVLAEWQTLVDRGVEGFNKLQGMLNRLPWNISEDQIDQAVSQVTGFLTSSQFGAGALSGLSAAGNFFTGLALLLVILFFFLKDGDRIWAFFLSWMPDHQMHRWLSTGGRTVETLGGYMRGTATVAAVDAIAITVVLLILRVPLAIPLGVVVFMSSFIPLIGATFAGILATLIALVTNGPVIALIVLGAVIVVNQLEGNFLQPVVMAHALNLHALVILLSLAAGTVLGGLVGAVLAVPLTAVAWGIVKIWADRDLPELDPGADPEKEAAAGEPTAAQVLAHAESNVSASAHEADAMHAAGSQSPLKNPKNSDNRS